MLASNDTGPSDSSDTFHRLHRYGTKHLLSRSIMAFMVIRDFDNLTLHVILWCWVSTKVLGALLYGRLSTLLSTLDMQMAAFTVKPVFTAWTVCPRMDYQIICYRVLDIVWGDYNCHFESKSDE